MSATHRLLRFGVFELNLDTEELRKLGTIVRLRPQPCRLLALLASRAGQVVTREEIQQQLWGGDTYVDFEHGMNRCIKQIREVLGDDTDKPIYIETLPRQGYRFLVPVTSKTVAGPKPAVVESDSGELTRAKALGALRSRSSTTRPQALPEQAVPVLRVAVQEAETAAEVGRAASDQRPAGWRRSWLWIAAVIFGIVAVGVLTYPNMHSVAIKYLDLIRIKRAGLTEKDTIVVADFQNSSGDPVFDGTLRQGLSVDLEQSPFLKILSDEHIAHTMDLMGHPKGDSLTPEVAREVCVRTGSAATIEGAIAALGKDYVVGLRAIRCDTDHQIAAEQFTVSSKEQILPALGEVASRLRGALGESLLSVHKYNAPLEDVTTPSLEALQAYTLGRKMLYAKGESAALPFFRRATELDPNFARPYVSMSVAYGNLNQTARASQCARQAYMLRGKVSERERFSIDASYYMTVTGELENAAQTYEQWQQSYPREAGPYANLGFVYGVLGMWPKALEEYREVLRLEPDDETNYSNLGAAYVSLSRFPEAGAVYKDATDHKLEGEFLILNRYQLAFMENDAVQMTSLISSAGDKAGQEDFLLASQADTAAWHGRFKIARGLTSRAIGIAEKNDAKEAAAIYEAATALREAAVGKISEARAAASAAMKLAPNRDVLSMAGVALAQAGDAPQAKKLATELDKEFPLDMLVQKYWLSTIRASIALEEQNPRLAMQMAGPGSTIELGQPTSLSVALCPVYVRGQAYLALHDGSSAAAEFQKFIDQRGVLVNFPWGALARLGLARSYAMQGDTVKARAAYEDFLTLWKDADPDIPVYSQAKAEYKKLLATTN